LTQPIPGRVNYQSPEVLRGRFRDHWTQGGFTFVAGGGFKMGQVIGATTARTERPAGKAYIPQNVLATLSGLFGIDPATMLPDHNVPTDLLDERERVAELL
jgi:hypothetical protein